MRAVGDAMRNSGYPEDTGNQLIQGISSLFLEHTTKVQQELSELSNNERECRLQMQAMSHQIDSRDETIEHLRLQLHQQA